MKEIVFVISSSCKLTLQLTSHGYRGIIWDCVVGEQWCVSCICEDMDWEKVRRRIAMYGLVIHKWAFDQLVHMNSV